LRRILLELRGTISGQPELRDAFKDLLKNRAADLAALQQYVRARYRQLLIDPTGASAPAAPATPPALPDNVRSLVESLLTASGMSAGNWKQLALVSSSDAAAPTPAAPTPAPPGAGAPTPAPGAGAPTPAPAASSPAIVNLQFRDQDEDFPYEDRFINSLGAF